MRELQLQVALQQEQRRQQRLQWGEESREREAARSEESREATRQATEDFRSRDNPEQRARRYLESAASSERDGNPRAARAYYLLVVRLVPDSEIAVKAKAALDQLVTAPMR